MEWGPPHPVTVSEVGLRGADSLKSIVSDSWPWRREFQSRARDKA